MYNICNKPQILLESGLVSTTIDCCMVHGARRKGTCSGVSTHQSRDWSGIGLGIGPGLAHSGVSLMRYFPWSASIVSLVMTMMRCTATVGRMLSEIEIFNLGRGH